MQVDHPWTLIWEAPMALASWGLYHSIRAVIGLLYRRYLSRNPVLSSQWRILSGQTLQQPLSLPVLMTTGPRWNTHAIIGTLGPFPVQGPISLDLPTLQQAAPSWVVVAYRYPDYATIQSWDSVQDLPQGPELRLDLPPGRYTLGLRYYLSGDRPIFPAVQVDGQLLCPATPAPDQPNAFYATLAERSNSFYRALHGYIYTLLRWRPYLPEAWVRREFLPVGAPDTRFVFDYIRCHDRLEIRIDLAVQAAYLLFLTRYNRASFPIASQQLSQPGWEDNGNQAGFYALRIRPRTAAAAAQLEQLRVQQGHRAGATWLQIGKVADYTDRLPPDPSLPSGQP
jgi:hypothetical protein